MDDNASAALSVICRDYRDSFVPPAFPSSDEWADTERANRWFVAIGLAGSDALFHGAQRVVEHLDALCRVACTKHIVSLTKHPLLEDLAPRTLGLVVSDTESELLPHLQWLIACVNGRAGDVTSLWRGREPHEAFEGATRLYKSDVPAFVLVRETTGARSRASASPDALFAATRLGIVSWTESVLDELGGYQALHDVLDGYDDETAWEALEWFSLVQCNAFHQRCTTCAVSVDCHALALGI